MSIELLDMLNDEALALRTAEEIPVPLPLQHDYRHALVPSGPFVPCAPAVLKLLKHGVALVAWHPLIAL